MIIPWFSHTSAVLSPQALAMSDKLISSSPTITKLMQQNFRHSNLSSLGRSSCSRMRTTDILPMTTEITVFRSSFTPVTMNELSWTTNKIRLDLSSFMHCSLSCHKIYPIQRALKLMKQASFIVDGPVPLRATNNLNITYFSRGCHLNVPTPNCSAKSWRPDACHFELEDWTEKQPSTTVKTNT